MNKRASDLTDINLVGLNEGRFMIAHENFPNGRSRLCNSAAGCGFSRLAALLSRACPFPHDDKAAASARRPRGKRPGRRGAGRDETRRDDPRGAQAGFPSHPPVGTGSRPVPELRAGKGRAAALLAYWPRGPGRWRVSAEGPGSPPARGLGEGTLSRPLSGSAINFLVSLPI